MRIVDTYRGNICETVPPHDTNHKTLSHSPNRRAPALATKTDKRPGGRSRQLNRVFEDGRSLIRC